MDINAPTIKEELAKVSGATLERGFDTITFSYSLSMIPEWEKALYSAKGLMSEEGRVLVADFDTYTEKGNSVKDILIRTWYRQDGVRIEAKSREVILEQVFEGKEYTKTCARMQRRLAGVWIPHYVACARRGTITMPDGFRRPSVPDLSKLLMSQEEKKQDF